MLAVSITLNIFFVITIGIMFAIFNKMSDECDVKNDQIENVIERLDSYRMYIASIQKDYRKGVDTCEMIESLGEKF